MPLVLPPWPPRWPEIQAALQECWQSGQWGRYRSEVHDQLRQRLIEIFAVDQLRLCCSGSAAVEIALRAAGVSAGDEVIVAAWDYPGNFRSIELLGARPVLVDVADDSLGVCPHDLIPAASERVRAVIASHLFGVATDVPALRQICDDHGWVLIEDACQIPGMQIDGRPAGSFGHLSTLSFGGSKPLTAGNGGAVLASDPRCAARLGPLLDRPSDAFALSPLQAAVLLPQLDRLEAMNKRRSETAAFLRQQVMPPCAGWRWESGEAAHSAYYKVAWSTPSAQHRQRVIAAALQHGLPIGEGFRSMSRSSERRCRKPVVTPRSEQLGETAVVLDQRALLIELDQQEALAEVLQQVYREAK